MDVCQGQAAGRETPEGLGFHEPDFPLSKVGTEEGQVFFMSLPFHQRQKFLPYGSRQEKQRARGEGLKGKGEPVFPLELG